MKRVNILDCTLRDGAYLIDSQFGNTAIKGIAHSYKNRGNHIITSKIEHPAVLESCKELENEGFEVTYISVDENGIINLDIDLQ